MRKSKNILTQEEYDKPIPFSELLDVLQHSVASCESYIEDKASPEIRTDGASSLLLAILFTLVAINTGQPDPQKAFELLHHIVDEAEKIYDQYLKN